MESGKVVAVRGGGDIATGTICRLHRCGFRVVVLEAQFPLAIRRAVSLAEAVYEGSHTVEDITAVHITTINACNDAWQGGVIPVLVDPLAESLRQLQPHALIDAILAKRNCGTHREMALITIGLGPGFTAGIDVNAVIETARGHDLGRILFTGSAMANTGIPGLVEGYTTERVIYAPQSGTLNQIRDIGSQVICGEPLATIDNTPVAAPFSGIVRGMIRNNSTVRKGLKIADIDPRLSEQQNCYTISDKSRCISGGVLEALLYLSHQKKE